MVNFVKHSKSSRGKDESYASDGWLWCASLVGEDAKKEMTIIACLSGAVLCFR